MSTDTRALAFKCIELTRTEAQTHGEMIDALLTAFIAVAVAHPCCAGVAAEEAARASALISKLAGTAITTHHHVH